MLLNTGDKRSVIGNAVSGGVAGLLVASYVNYKEYKKGKITQNNAIRGAIKVSAQAAVATGCAIGVANALGDGNKSTLQSLLESSAYILVGVVGVCVIDKISETKLLGGKNGNK